MFTWCLEVCVASIHLQSPCRFPAALGRSMEGPLFSPCRSGTAHPACGEHRPGSSHTDEESFRGQPRGALPLPVGSALQTDTENPFPSRPPGRSDTVGEEPERLKNSDPGHSMGADLERSLSQSRWEGPAPQNLHFAGTLPSPDEAPWKQRRGDFGTSWPVVRGSSWGPGHWFWLQRPVWVSRAPCSERKHPGLFRVLPPPALSSAIG